MTIEAANKIKRSEDLGEIPVERLKPDPRNARKHPDKQLHQIAASIRRFGFCFPVLVDENYRLIAGHARLAAGKSLGLASVPAQMIAGLSEREKQALALADNKIPQNASWDVALLVEALTEICLEIENPEITGFSTTEIDDLLVVEPPGNDEEPPEVRPTEPPISRRSEVWQLGDHRLVCASALDSEAYDALLGGEVARMTITDPPYNVRIGGHVSGLGRQTHREFLMGSSEMTSSQFSDFLTTALVLIAKYSVEGAIAFVFMDWRHGVEIATAGDRAKLELKNLVVWAKNNGGMGTFYRSAHEFIYVFKHGTAPHLNNFGLGENGRYRTNVWTYPGVNTFRKGRDEELAMHPTVKPVALVADAIRDVSKRKDVVLDPFGGSGTTLIAAEKTGRRARLIELDPAYVDVAIRRWQKFTGKSAVLLATGKSFNELSVEREKPNA